MAKKEEPLRLGIIGSGLAVKWLHWPALKRLADNYRIIITADTDPAAAQEVAGMAGKDLNSPNCRWTTDYREVLASDDVEAVLISLPIHLNAQVMLDAARAGKHIICEKPLAANWEQAFELTESLKSYDQLVIEIAENFHYRSDFLKAKEWVRAGRIGQPFLVEMATRFWTDTNSGFSATPWRQDNQYRGGVISDAAVHHAAGMRELGGEVEQLHAFVKSVHPVMGGSDTMVLNLRYRNGALGNLVFAGAVKATDAGFFQATVYGTEGAVRLSSGKAVLSLGVNQDAKIVEEFSEENFDNGYFAEFDNFFKAVRHREPVVATVEEALRDWEIIMRAFDSAEKRSVILF